MKIVTWNCNGAFRKKFHSILALDADLFVIQECENPLETQDKDYMEWASNYLWIGSTKNKGLGVFASPNIKLQNMHWPDTYKDHTVKHFLPCSVNNKFQLLAVWTHYNNSPNFGYMGQFWKYLQVNKDKFDKIIIVGDFNSNVIWDEWDRWWNHSDVVRELNEVAITSLYHTFTGEEQGKETQPTFFLHRNLNKPYHIDYCFASTSFASNRKHVDVQKYDNWKHLSDHVPMVFAFETE